MGYRWDKGEITLSRKKKREEDMSNRLCNRVLRVLLLHVGKPFGPEYGCDFNPASRSLSFIRLYKAMYEIKRHFKSNYLTKVYV